MVISKLSTYQNITDKSNARTHAIDTITPHCIVGQWSAKQGADYFKTNGKENSVNYVIGYDGQIACSVPEDRRAWTSSSKTNDMRAVTIEIASDTTKPYRMTSKALDALEALMVDICKRNGIEKLVWSDKSADRKNHKNGCNITLHRDFANTSCPGDYLVGLLPAIVQSVNKQLGTPAPFDWSKVKKGDKVVTDKDYPVATSESKAIKGQYAKKLDGSLNVYKAGEYYIYKVSGECVNISKTKLLPGGWILP